MKRLLFLLIPVVMIGSTGMSGCKSLEPQNYASQTIQDERLAITAETSYTAASRLGAIAAKTGYMDKEKFKALDQKGYDLLLKIRVAYKSGNQADLLNFIGDMNQVVGEIQALAKGS